MISRVRRSPRTMMFMGRRAKADRRNEEQCSHYQSTIPITSEDRTWNRPVWQKQLPSVLVVTSVVISRMITFPKPSADEWSLQYRESHGRNRLKCRGHWTLVFSGWNFNCVELVSIFKGSLKGHICHLQVNVAHDLHLQNISKFNDYLPKNTQTIVFFLLP